MSDNTARGLYLVNATGEMTALHTADGGDQQVLREYLEEWDLPKIEVDV
jgi:hypothetical protein